MNNFAIITGASTGIGKELARIHAQKKGDLILVARRKTLLESLRDELQLKYKVQVEVIEMDLSKPRAGISLANIILDKGIKIRFLFNNAGFGG
jgi:short-subunit dehydrogenase